MPSAISRVVKPCRGVTVAPASLRICAACSTTAATPGSSGRPQPASSSKPMFRPRTVADGSSGSAVHARSCGGRLVASRASGRLSTAIALAASSTVRVSGPQARPV
jgi:hypothetical protein